MQIQIRSDPSIAVHAPLSEHVKSVVESSMERFESRITRVEVHLGDENRSHTGTPDKRCTMEVRLAGHEPMAVTHHAVSVDEAISGAADKLVSAVGHLVGRLEHH